jgi:hypothetical protein
LSRKEEGVFIFDEANKVGAAIAARAFAGRGTDCGRVVGSSNVCCVAARFVACNAEMAGERQESCGVLSKLFSSLVQVLDDYEVAYVSSRVEAVEVQDKQERRVLGVAGEDETEESTHRTVFVGQPALKDVKHVLDKMGFACEFQQGTLVVNDVVTVRKELVSGSAVLRVEGAFCPDLFEVRNVVYGQLKML